MSAVSPSGVEKDTSPACTSFPLKRSSSDSVEKGSDRPTTSATQKITKPLSTSCHNTSILNYGVRTTEEEKEKLDSTISPFKIVERPAFIDVVNGLRPGYKLPTRKDIGGSLLDKVYDKECENKYGKVRRLKLCA